MFFGETLKTQRELQSGHAGFMNISRNIPKDKRRGLNLGVALVGLFENNINAAPVYLQAINKALQTNPPSEIPVGSQFMAYVGDPPNTIYVSVNNPNSDSVLVYQIDVTIDEFGFVNWRKINKISAGIGDKLFQQAKKQQQGKFDESSNYWSKSQNKVPLFGDFTGQLESNLTKAGFSADVVSSAVAAVDSNLDVKRMRVLHALKAKKISVEESKILEKLINDRKPYRFGVARRALVANEVVTLQIENEIKHVLITPDAMAAAVEDAKTRLPLPVCRDHTDGNLESIVGCIHELSYDASTGVVSLGAVELYKENEMSKHVCKMMDAGQSVGVSVKGSGSDANDVVYQKTWRGLERSRGFGFGMNEVRIREYRKFTINGWDLVMHPAVDGAKFVLV